MSYDIELLDPVSKKIIELDYVHQMTGGTYQVGGSTSAELNITYNYSRFFYEQFGDKGIRTIYGMSALESIPLLEKAISNLGNDVSDDYWEPTEGNAKSALIKLLTLAKIRPDAIWSGD